MNYQYNVVIPLAGKGKRFKDAGFSDHKSVLDINGSSMLERIMEKFPYEPNFYLLTIAFFLFTIYRMRRRTAASGGCETTITKEGEIHRLKNRVSSQKN